MVEYGLILAMIFLAMMVGVAAVGTTTASMWNNVSDARPQQQLRLAPSVRRLDAAKGGRDRPPFSCVRNGLHDFTAARD